MDSQSGTFRAGQQSTVFPTAPVGFLYEGDRGVAPGIANTSFTRFAPRLGFAWDVYGDGRTSIRGGFGIFYYQQVAYDNELRVQQPYGLSVLTVQPPSYRDPYSGNSPFPYIPNPQSPKFVSYGTVYAVAPGGGSNPYAEEFNLSVEQQLNKNFGLRVSYVGSNFLKQFINVDLNAPVLPASRVGAASANARRPYEPYGTLGSYQFGTIDERLNANNNHYNSLQVVLHGRINRSVDLNTSYVWSKALDYETPPDSTNIRTGYGAASTDLRHRFVLSGLFSLPGTTKFGWFGKQVISGWHLNDITILQSGAPFTVTSGTDYNLGRRAERLSEHSRKTLRFSVRATGAHPWVFECRRVSGSDRGAISHDVLWK